MDSAKLTAYQRIISLVSDYLNKKETSFESDKFCNLYMDLYFDNSDELYSNLSEKQFELLDELNLICDSYEQNIEIRKTDRFCIDEKELRNKVELHYKELKSLTI